MMTNYLKDIIDKFDFDGKAVSCERYGAGHINETYLVATNRNVRYILQKVNDLIFPDMDALMSNIAAVTAWLAKRTADPRGTMQLVKTKNGENYLRHTDGTPWRAYVFIEDAICLQQAESPSDFYESAVAFGTFQQLLTDFPAQTLHETIPNFHDTRDRYRIFKEALEADRAGRAKDVQEEIAFALEREADASIIADLLDCGELPLRVTHNDTKLNNVMLDKETRTALCVLDLDTVMPGSSLYDYGDSIRFGASTAAEDEKDLNKVEMSLELYRVYTEGFLKACPDLTALELKLLPLGAKLMSLECGVRFLTDYLDGDCYFAIHRPEHNLDRCRTQFKLVADMESKWDQMLSIVEELSCK